MLKRATPHGQVSIDTSNGRHKEGKRLQRAGFECCFPTHPNRWGVGENISKGQKFFLLCRII